MSSIGVFDSGFGGLTVLKELQKSLPQYNYIYLGDNARAPYGEKSFETVNIYTQQAMDWLMANDCPLVILACNTASAVALRNIQQLYLHQNYPAHSRVLGVVRPTTEVVGTFSKTGVIGLLGTVATVSSNSYAIEINKFFPQVELHQLACPLWVPIIENGIYTMPGSQAVIKENVNQLLEKNPNMDVILLACTHYPIVANIIKEHVGESVKVISQGEIIANSLKNYLRKHTALDAMLDKDAETKIYTSEEDLTMFRNKASRFFDNLPKVQHAEPWRQG